MEQLHHLWIVAIDLSKFNLKVLLCLIDVLAVGFAMRVRARLIGHILVSNQFIPIRDNLLSVLQLLI